MNRGDIHLCDFGSPIGHEPGWQRPAVLVADERIARHGLPIIVPVTRTRRDYPTHVELEGVLPVTSYAQCEQIRAVSDARLIRKLGTVDDVQLAKIDLVLRRILCLV